ncbi:hypothetical protein [Halomicrobium zhouii]|nr:hypothetical protein [Halomicrobium zhouii]
MSDGFADELTPPDNWEYPVDRFVTALDLAERGASDQEVRKAVREVEDE